MSYNLATCVDCGSEERDHYNLFRHRLRHHLPWQFSPFLCNFCQSGFIDRSQFTTHTQTNTHNKAVMDVQEGAKTKSNADSFRQSQLSLFHQARRISDFEYNKIIATIPTYAEDRRTTFSTPTQDENPTDHNTLERWMENITPSPQTSSSSSSSSSSSLSSLLNYQSTPENTISSAPTTVSSTSAQPPTLTFMPITVSSQVSSVTQTSSITTPASAQISAMPFPSSAFRRLQPATSPIRTLPRCPPTPFRPPPKSAMPMPPPVFSPPLKRQRLSDTIPHEPSMQLKLEAIAERIDLIEQKVDNLTQNMTHLVERAARSQEEQQKYTRELMMTLQGDLFKLFDQQTAQLQRIENKQTME